MEIARREALKVHTVSIVVLSGVTSVFPHITLSELIKSTACWP